MTNVVRDWCSRHPEVWKITLLVAVICLIIYASGRPSVANIMVSWLDQVQQMGATSIPFIFLFYLACNAPTFLPTNFLHITCGFAYGLWLGLLVAESCYTVSTLPPFLAARGCCQSYVEKQVTNTKQIYRAILTAIKREPVKTVVSARMSPVIPGSINNLIFGIADVSIKNYLVGSAIGIMPQLAFYVYIGTLLNDVKEVMQGDMDSEMKGPGYWALLVVGLVMTLGLFGYMSKKATRILREFQQEEKTAKQGAVSIQTTDHQALI